jgi:hypothetical protein
MASNNIVPTIEEKKKESKNNMISKSGIKILGYIIPWWIILIILLLIIYAVHTHKLFDEETSLFPREIKLNNPPTYMKNIASTPVEIRDFSNRIRKY